MIDSTQFGIDFQGDVGTDLRFCLLNKLRLDTLGWNSKHIVTDSFDLGIKIFSLFWQNSHNEL